MRAKVSSTSVMEDIAFTLRVASALRIRREWCQRSAKRSTKQEECRPSYSGGGGAGEAKGQLRSSKRGSLTSKSTLNVDVVDNDTEMVTQCIYAAAAHGKTQKTNHKGALLLEIEFFALIEKKSRCFWSEYTSPPKSKGKSSKHKY